jgi:spermidine synthase
VLPGGPRRIGAVGLGTGTVAAYGRHGDSFRFYEINPAIVAVASRTFTYLKDTPATTSIALGDARLVMERELRAGQAQQFDLLVLDAFSGDAIPVHLLTREAMAVYLGQLRPGGIIAVHISNRHLDLRPAVEGLARDAGLHYVTISDNLEQDRWWLHSTVWVLVSADQDLFDRDGIRLDAQDATDQPGKSILWTDDHASLLEVLK